MEPTQGPVRCVDRVFGVDWGQVLHGLLYPVEYNYFAMVFPLEGGGEAWLILFVGVDCVEAVALRVVGCGEARKRVYSITDWPEVSRVDVEGDCVYAIVPGDPPYRLRAALEKLGVGTPDPGKASRLEPLDDLEVEEWLGAEVPGQGVA